MSIETGLYVLVLLAISGYAANIPKYDTIVVGLGSAGTTAASTLARAGKHVLALEAQERVGGRINTVPFGDGVVEVGAEWIHGTENSVVYNLGLQNNISMLSQQFTTNMKPFWSNTTLGDVELINELASIIMAELEKDGEGEAKPAGEHLANVARKFIKERRPEWPESDVQSLIRFYELQINSYEGSNNWNDLSTSIVYEPLKGDLYMSWHRNGYKTFFELLLNKYNNGQGLPTLDIKLNTEVITITWPQDAQQKVTVICKDGTVYTADNVIITISVGVLKERYGTLFSPALSEEKIAAIKSIAMGVVDKVIFRFPYTWWDSSKDASYGFLWKEEDIKKVPEADKWTTEIPGTSSPMGTNNAMTLWYSGETAKHIEKLSEEVVKEKCMQLMRRFIDPHVNLTIPEPLDFIRSTWYSNPFTRGSYTYEGVEELTKNPTARFTLAQPLTDSLGVPRVLFAGEATNLKHYSTVHGASETGRREATRILDIAN